MKSLGILIPTIGLLAMAGPAAAQSGSYSLGNGVVTNSGDVINTSGVQNSMVNNPAVPVITPVKTVVQRFIPLEFHPTSGYYPHHYRSYRPTFSLNFQFNAPIVSLCTTRDTIVSSNGTVFRSETTAPCQ
jgi:hypothetical protein